MNPVDDKSVTVGSLTGIYDGGRLWRRVCEREMSQAVLMSPRIGTALKPVVRRCLSRCSSTPESPEIPTTLDQDLELRQDIKHNRDIFFSHRLDRHHVTSTGTWVISHSRHSAKEFDRRS